MLYDKHVVIPATTTDAKEWEGLFKLSGFNGCIGSTDATHIGMLKCSNWASINHKGHKLNIPSRTYNTTVTHTRQILATTFGHPATWNDKTVILYDNLVQKVNNGQLYNDYEFKLLEKNNDGDIVEVRYRGVWFITDNGYLSWSCTVPPIKNGSSYKEIRFSEWLESMRKDVECTFGILKQRFAILRYGVRLQSIEKCDQLYLTCCALHNRLLFFDELHKNWESISTSDCELNSIESITFAVSRLNSDYHIQEHQVRDNAHHTNIHQFDKYLVDGSRIVSKMPLKVFQDRLVHHFDIRFYQNSIAWPKRK